MVIVGMVVAVSAIAAGVAAQRLCGLGLSLLCVRFLGLVLGPLDAIRLTLLLGFPVNLAIALGSRHAIRWRQVAALGVPGALCTPVVALLARHAARGPLLLAAGVACLLGVTMLATDVRWRALHGPAGAIGAGVLSAAMNAVAGMSGPPVALYGLSADWSAEQLRANLSAYYFLLGIVAVPSLGWAWVPVWVVVAVAVAGLAGDLAGRLAQRRLKIRQTRRVVLAISAIAGVLTVARAFS